jgi:hypothetical protein
MPFSWHFCCKCVLLEHEASWPLLAGFFVSGRFHATTSSLKSLVNVWLGLHDPENSTTLGLVHENHETLRGFSKKKWISP